MDAATFTYRTLYNVIATLFFPVYLILLACAGGDGFSVRNIAFTSIFIAIAIAQLFFYWQAFLTIDAGGFTYYSPYSGRTIASWHDVKSYRTWHGFLPRTELRLANGDRIRIRSGMKDLYKVEAALDSVLGEIKEEGSLLGLPTAG